MGYCGPGCPRVCMCVYVCVLLKRFTMFLGCRKMLKFAKSRKNTYKKGKFMLKLFKRSFFGFPFHVTFLFHVAV